MRSWVPPVTRNRYAIGQIVLVMGDRTLAKNPWTLRAYKITARDVTGIQNGVDEIVGEFKAGTTPDGTTIATSWVYLAHGPMVIVRAGQVVSLWDVVSGDERPLDAEAAFNLHFLNGGNTLACADGLGAGGARSTDDLHHGTMEIWDVAAGRKMHKFESSVDWSGTLAFSPDRKLFASGSGKVQRVRVHAASS